MAAWFIDNTIASLWVLLGATVVFAYLLARVLGD